MTLGAFVGLECVFAVMAGAAGEPLFHLGHRDPPLVLCRGQVELGVTVAALVQTRVKFMAEYDGPVSFTLNATSLTGWHLAHSSVLNAALPLWQAPQESPFSIWAMVTGFLAARSIESWGGRPRNCSL